MLSADVLIEAIQRRMQLVAPHRNRAAGEFPPGWQQWLAALGEQGGTVTGATAQSLLDIFLQRPLVNPPRRDALLNRWQAFATLWRQQWHPPARDDRSLRWFAGAMSTLLHVLGAVFLLSLMYQADTDVSPPPLGEEVVQVEFIGAGTPAEVGGGAAPVEPSETDSAPASDAAAAETTVERPVAGTKANPTAALPELEAPLPDVAQRDIPEPQLPAPISVQQPVMVSAPTSGESTVFMLPPPTPRLADSPEMAPELTAPSRPVKALDVPEPVQPISRALPSREFATRPIPSRLPDVAVREVPAPMQRAPLPALPASAITQPQLSARTPQVRPAEIPTPRGPATDAPRSPTGTSIRSDAGVPKTGTSTATVAPGSSAASTAGTGPKAAASTGGWPTPAQSDEWGDSTRNREGGQRGVPAGVYNSDGSVRLADTAGSASPGLPPGTVDDRISNLDRAGTWLKRKPNDHEPTSLDKYWRPNESLLAEWVRKSITTVRIPIPGTNKHIVCQTVLLALGGGCGITDPNLNEQPPTARPPPDIPFKPELQEDNGSIRPAG